MQLTYFYIRFTYYFATSLKMSGDVFDADVDLSLFYLFYLKVNGINKRKMICFNKKKMLR